MTPEIRIEVDALVSQFRLDESAYRLALQAPVVQDLAKRAIRVESMAKRIATGPPGSAPGQGPGVVTGRLRASITWRPGQDEEGPYVDIGSNVLYAPYLELGTSRMAARPFLQPALVAAH